MYVAGALLAGRYRLEQQLGAGGMGEVWRATDERLGRTVAVKLMSSALMDDANFAARFRAEARAMATVGHPAVVEIHDYHSDPPPAFLVMRYVDGEPLTRVLGREGRLSPARTMMLIAQAADGLHAVHEKQIVHRDVKPGNLMLSRDGRLLLTDFSISRTEAATRLTRPDLLVGTARYMSPEQADRGPVAPASDVYSLGVVAYECLAGRPPFTSGGMVEIALRHVREAPPALPPDIPAAVRQVVERALAKSPTDRWPSAAAFAAVARSAAAEVGSGWQPPAAPGSPWPPPPLTPPGGPPAGRSRGRRWALVVAGVIAAAVIGAVAIIVPAVTGGGAQDPGATGPGATDAPTSVHSGPTPSAPAASTEDPFSAVPSEFLGMWEGTVLADNGNEHLRRVLIRQGAEGDRLIETRRVREDVLCEFIGTLTSADSSAIELENEVVRSIPDGTCAAGSPQTLQLGGPDRLELTGGDISGTLIRVSEAPDSVPVKYLGTWIGTITSSSDSREVTKKVVVENGRIGEDLVTSTTSGSDFLCEDKGMLVSTEGKFVFFTHEVTYVDPPDSSCSALGVQQMRTRADGSMRWSGGDSSGTLTRDE